MKKLKSRRGTTLVELLCALLILTLISSAIVLGMQLGLDSYQDSMSRSEAQMLCATLTTVLSDDLRYASNIRTDDFGNPSFSSSGFNSRSSSEEMRFTVDGSGRLLWRGNAVIDENSYSEGIRLADMDDTGQAEDKTWIKYGTSSGGRNVFTVHLVIISTEEGTVLSTTEFEVDPLNQ